MIIEDSDEDEREGSIGDADRRPVEQEQDGYDEEDGQYDSQYGSYDEADDEEEKEEDEQEDEQEDEEATGIK